MAGKQAALYAHFWQVMNLPPSNQNPSRNWSSTVSIKTHGQCQAPHLPNCCHLSGKAKSRSCSTEAPGGYGVSMCQLPEQC